MQLPEGLNIIGSNAFKDKGITSFKILDSVQEVRAQAFAGNPDLDPVHIRNFLPPIIAEDAFPNGWFRGYYIECYEMEGGNNGDITITNYRANMEGCPERIRIPYGITRIGNAAFRDKLLTRVIFPETITHIGHGAFHFNQDLGDVVIPDSVVYIGNSAFSRSSVRNVTLSEGLRAIGTSVFQENKLTSVTIPNSVTSIGRSAFKNNQLTTISIPDNVTSIGDLAFQDNDLTSVSFGGSVRSIGYSAFENNLLTTVAIPDGITVIKSDVFRNNNLTSVTMGPMSPELNNLLFPTIWERALM